MSLGIDSEVKNEIIVDRRSGFSSSRFTHRLAERLPAGSDFNFSFSLRIFDGDESARFFNYLADGLDLIEKDYLGAYGSRGFGHVKFTDENDRPLSALLRQMAGQLTFPKEGGL
jgi:CRISPR-associated protein Csm3